MSRGFFICFQYIFYGRQIAISNRIFDEKILASNSHYLKKLMNNTLGYII